MTLRSKIGLLIIIIGVIFIVPTVIGAVVVYLTSQVHRVVSTETFASVTSSVNITNYAVLGTAILLSTIAILFGISLRKQ